MQWRLRVRRGVRLCTQCKLKVVDCHAIVIAIAMTNIKAANMKKDGNKIWYIGEKKSEAVQPESC